MSHEFRLIYKKYTPAQCERASHVDVRNNAY